MKKLLKNKYIEEKEQERDKVKENGYGGYRIKNKIIGNDQKCSKQSIKRRPNTNKIWLGKFTCIIIFDR